MYNLVKVILFTSSYIPLILIVILQLIQAIFSVKNFSFTNKIEWFKLFQEKKEMFICVGLLIFLIIVLFTGC